MAKFTWNEENTQTLIEAVANVEVVSQEQQQELAEQIGTTKRSIGSKLRSMVKQEVISVEVALASKTESQWTEEETQELREFVEANAGAYTYSKIAELFNGSKWSSKKIQGKLLSMELSGSVKPSPTPERAAKTYSDAEEAQIIELAANGTSLEDVAEAVGRELNSVRGKCLSLLRQVEGFVMPVQKNRVERAPVDMFEGLDADTIKNMTVAVLAETTGRTERAVKSSLTRRAITAKDYDGAKKAAKRAAKKDAE
jgi:hypothetical protein